LCVGTMPDAMTDFVRQDVMPIPLPWNKGGATTTEEWQGREQSNVPVIASPDVGTWQSFIFHLSCQAGATLLVAPKYFGSVEGRLNQLKVPPLRAGNHLPVYASVIASPNVGTWQSFFFTHLLATIHHKLFLFLHCFQ